MRPRAEFNIVVCHEVDHLDADDRASDESHCQLLITNRSFSSPIIPAIIRAFESRLPGWLRMSIDFLIFAQPLALLGPGAVPSVRRRMSILPHVPIPHGLLLDDSRLLLFIRQQPVHGGEGGLLRTRGTRAFMPNLVLIVRRRIIDPSFAQAHYTSSLEARRAHRAQVFDGKQVGMMRKQEE